MIYGYVRTSRKSQNVERQIRNILQHSSDAAILKEAYRSAEKDAVPTTGTEADCILAGVNEFLSVLRKKQFKLA